jgi:translation elongation factor EF-G
MIICSNGQVVHDVAKGLIVYLRVYSGTLSFGPKVFNVNKGQHERYIVTNHCGHYTFLFADVLVQGNEADASHGSDI